MQHEAFLPLALGVAGVLLILAGLAFAFFGRRIWKGLMTVLGILVGGALGLVAGLVLGGPLGALVGAVVGALLGGLLFGLLVKVALALLAGLLAAGAVFVLLGGGTPPAATPLAGAVALFVLVAVFILAYVLMDALLGVLTALVGGFLLGAGAFLVLTRLAAFSPQAAASLAVGAGALVFLGGAVVQVLAARKED